MRGVGGRTRKAKTIRAVRLTTRDMLTSLVATATPRFGGLRGGYAVVGLRPAKVRLVGYQYVPGVKVSGTLRRIRGRLTGTLSVFGGGSAPAQITVSRSGSYRARFAGAGPAGASASSAGEPLGVPARPRRPAVPGPLPDAPRSPRQPLLARSRSGNERLGPGPVSAPAQRRPGAALRERRRENARR